MAEIELQTGEQMFLQAMMQRPYVSIAEAKALASKALSRLGANEQALGEEAFNELHERINRAINPFELELRIIAVHRDRFMAIANLARDSASSDASSLRSHADVAFFRALLELLCSSAQRISDGVPRNKAVNAELDPSEESNSDLSSLGQQARRLTVNQREAAIDTFIKEGWIDSVGSDSDQSSGSPNVRLWPRSVLELGEELRGFASDDAAEALGLERAR